MVSKFLTLFEINHNNSLDPFEQWYCDFFTPLYRYVYFRTGDDNLSLDIVQTIFTKLYTNRNSIQGITVRQYLYTAAHNQLIDYFRKKRPILFDQGDYFMETIVDETILNPEEMSIIYNTTTNLRKVVAELPLVFQDVITLRFLQELEYSEIAIILGKNEPTVRKMVSRAVQQLKILLEHSSHHYEI
jgi:RNA polymerase sigma-70 factor (ECF subfamily)